jgi:hypothetical protein
MSIYCVKPIYRYNGIRYSETFVHKDTYDIGRGQIIISLFWRSLNRHFTVLCMADGKGKQYSGYYFIVVFSGKYSPEFTFLIKKLRLSCAASCLVCHYNVVLYYINAGQLQVLIFCCTV